VSGDTSSVVKALSAVMEDVQAVGKKDRNTQQNYSFRGVDAVVNAVGPALRKHSVIVVPVSVSSEVEHYQTSKGTAMRNVTLTVGFRFYGPNGDWIEASASGEAADSGDKATPKAHSVAYRTLLLQALCIPTDEPDPDSESHERAADTAAPKKDSAEAVSQAQHKKLAVLLKKLEAYPSPEGVADWTAYAKNWIFVQFGKQSRADLTKAEMSQLIKELDEMSIPF
jgi:hypothetical protein